MNRILIAAVLALTMQACATPVYVDAQGKQASQQTIDECEYDAAKATASATDTNPMQGPMGGVHALLTNSTLRRMSLARDCMKVRGYK